MKTVTIVYEVVNEESFKNAGNLLKLEHSGMKAYSVAAYDAIEDRRNYRQALEQIGRVGFDEAAKIAREALK